MPAIGSEGTKPLLGSPPRSRSRPMERGITHVNWWRGRRLSYKSFLVTSSSCRSAPKAYGRNLVPGKEDFGITGSMGPGFEGKQLTIGKNVGQGTMRSRIGGAQPRRYHWRRGKTLQTQRHCTNSCSCPFLHIVPSMYPMGSLLQVMYRNVNFRGTNTRRYQ